MTVRRSATLANQPDPRTQRTRELLYEALVRLIKAKGFDRLTVVDIAASARVNRNTFYRHYHDKHHMVRMILEESVETPSRLSSRAVPDEDPSCLKITCVLERIFDHFARHDQLFLSLLGRNGNSWFESCLRNFWLEREDDWLLPLASATGNEVCASDEATVVIAANVMAALVVWWFKDGRPCSSRALSEWCVQFFTGGLSAITTLKSEQKHPLEPSGG